MKYVYNILIFTMLALSACAQGINPTTHLKPAADTGQVLISNGPSNRFVYRTLYSYLKDSLNFGLAVVDSTRLTQDSILVYYNAGSEVGRDTVRTTGGGSVSVPGASGDLLYSNGSGGISAEAALNYNDAINTLYAGNAIYTAQVLGWSGDIDTYSYWTTDDQIHWAVGGVIPFFSLIEGATDYVTLGSGVGINFSSTSLINDGAGSTGTSGQYLKRSASGVEWADVAGGADQTLSWNGSTGVITISGAGGNSIDIDGRYLQSEVDGSITNEGSLTVGAGTATTSLINSNTSGSTPVTLQAGTNITLSEAGNTITIAASAGGGGTPGGSDSYVQYNNGGAFGGESTFTYDDVTNFVNMQNMYLTGNLRDGANTGGSNLELFTTTGSSTRWKTVAFDVTDGVFDFNLDGVTAASVDLSGANLSDAGKVFNDAITQNFYQVSPTKIIDWAGTANFTGDNIAWTGSGSEAKWTVTYAGKYRVKCMINVDGTSEATATPIRFEIRVNGSKAGIYYHYYADPDRFTTISIDEVFNLSASDYVEIYVQRGDAGTGKTVTFSATSESYFMVERINY